MINQIFGLKLLLIILISSYIIGSLNFSIIISKVYGKDIRNLGSHNAGLTNMYRNFGKKKTFIVFLIDSFKIIIGYMISFFFIGYNGTFFYILFVIIGHIYPIFFNFKGGKGVLLLAIWLLLFNYSNFIILLSIFILSLIKTKYVSLSIILNGIIMYLFISLNKIALNNYYYIILFLINFIFILHLSNIKRLLNKNENKYYNVLK